MGYVGKVKDTAGTTHLVGSTLYGTCSTAAATAAKVVTCSDFSELVTGVTIHVKFTYTNTAGNATLNVNSKGAKNLCCYGTTRVGTTEKTSWKAGAIVSFTYDGTSWVMNDYIPDTGDANTDYQVLQSGINDDDDYPILLKTSASETSETGHVNFADSTGKTSYPALNPSTGNLTNVSVCGVNVEHVPIAGIVLSDVGTGTTSLIVGDGDNYTLGDACERDVDASISAGSTSTNLPTSQAVAEYVATQAAGAATFQGTLVQTDSGGSATKWTQAELQAASYKKGWYWVVEAAGTYAGNVMEVGDMLFCVSDKSSAYAASDFTAIQNNIETLTTTEIDTLWAAA